MANLRRPGSFPALNLTQGGKAGNKDPRDRISGNNPFAQPDVFQFAQDRAELARRPAVPTSYAPAAAPDVIARTVPTKIEFVPWSITTPATAWAPVIWVPRNANRLGLILANDNAGTVHFSIGAPVLINGVTPIGIPLGAGAFQFSGGVVPIDDIYVFAATALQVVGYEGFEASGQ